MDSAEPDARKGETRIWTTYNYLRNLKIGPLRRALPNVEEIRELAPLPCGS